MIWELKIFNFIKLNSIFQNNFLETLKDEYHSKIKSNKNNTFDVTIKNLTNSIEINACYQDEFRKNDYIRKYNFNELKYIKYLLYYLRIYSLFCE